MFIPTMNICIRVEFLPHIAAKVSGIESSFNSLSYWVVKYLHILFYSIMVYLATLSVA
jgi:hypothetical protein